MPLLRWNSGDLVSSVDHSSGDGVYADLFPMIRHANRTTGFFKIRGVNINHAEFEEEMFRIDGLADFQAILETEAHSGREVLRVAIEVSAPHANGAVSPQVQAAVKARFEVSAVIEEVPLGNLAAVFEKSIKASRFLDRRT